MTLGLSRAVLRAEGKRLLRFGLVGLAATAVHLAVLAALIRWCGWAVLWANSLAFCAAFLMSFSGNYRWTFRARIDRAIALRRFLITSVAGFGLNTAVLAFMVHGMSMPALPSGMVAALLMPVFAYVASRVWVFRDPGPAAR
ncbi:MAG: GtrA family protein [Burkholderiales bacterium]|jgi:putative flippase GtrA